MIEWSMKSNEVEQERVDPEPLWTVREVAKFLRCSPSNIYALAARGEIPCHRIGNLLRFRPDAIQDWVNRSGTGAVIAIPRRHTERR